MQIQSINNSPNQKPVFQANLVLSATKSGKIKSEKLTVDVFNVNSDDSVFLSRILEVIKGEKFSGNKQAILSGDNINLTVKEFLKRAMKESPSKWFKNFFITVEDKKRITGVMDLTQKDSSVINNLVTWGDNKEISQKALLVRAMRETYSQRMRHLRVNTDSVKPEGVEVLKSANFEDAKVMIEDGVTITAYKHPLLRTPILEYMRRDEGLEFVENKSRIRKFVDLNTFFPKE